MYIAHADSPVGALTLRELPTARHSSGLWIDGQKYDRALLKGETVEECTTDELPIFRETARWLKLYFSGQEPNFYPRLSFSGSEFRKKIAREMLSVPYGRTASYTARGEPCRAAGKKLCVAPCDRRCGRA